MSAGDAGTRRSWARAGIAAIAETQITARERINIMREILKFVVLRYSREATAREEKQRWMGPG